MSTRAQLKPVSGPRARGVPRCSVDRTYVDRGRVEAVEVCGIAVAFLLERQRSHEFVHDKHGPL